MKPLGDESILPQLIPCRRITVSCNSDLSLLLLQTSQYLFDRITIDDIQNLDTDCGEFCPEIP